jgi:hypothetical protein
MNRIVKLAAPLIAVLAAAACNAGSSSSNIPNAPGSAGQAALARALPAPNVVTPACQGSRIGQAQCDVLILPGGARPTVSGWTATNIEDAYKLPSSSEGSGQIVAIVDAYDNPDVASDLAKYRSEFGLGTAKFYKYNQNGVQGDYPAGNPGWGVEIDLDTQMVSAGCPKCTIYLIEANNSNWNSLETAEKEAVKLGATIVSNSYSGSGASASDYDTSGITYVASSGDSGYGLYEPAAYQTVVAAGGTILSEGGGSRGWTDTVWTEGSSECSGGCGTGGGCNNVNVTKPSWQSDPDCKKRTGSDVASVAWDVALYISYGYAPGWYTVGGTSASSPLLASVFGLAGNSTSQDGGETFWNNKGAGLYTVSSGTILHCPSAEKGTYLCVAGTGQFGNFSGPDGWGVPDGTSAF